MRFAPNSKELIARLARVLPENDIYPAHGPHNASGHTLVAIGDAETAEKIAAVINDTLARIGEAPAAFAAARIKNYIDISATYDEKRTVALDTGGGREEIIVEAVESSSYQIRLALEGKPVEREYHSSPRH